MKSPGLASLLRRTVAYIETTDWRVDTGHDPEELCDTLNRWADLLDRHGTQDLSDHDVARANKQTLFAIGIEEKPGSFGMTHGPHPRLREMLSVAYHDPRACILGFGEDGVYTVLYRWRDTPEHVGWQAVEEE